MNILVHYILSDRNEELVAGNVVVDFIKGNKMPEFSPMVKKGIELHRVIDTFSDNHPAVRETWALLQSDFGHYGRVITDIYYDHFLFKHWKEHSEFTFEDDLEFLYASLKKHAPTFPPKVRRMVAKIWALQWPLKYTDMAGLYQVFRSMSKRVAFENKFELSVQVLQNNYNQIDDQFCRFFPELREHSNAVLKELLTK